MRSRTIPFEYDPSTPSRAITAAGMKSAYSPKRPRAASLLVSPLDADDYASIHEPDPRDMPPQARRGGPKIGRNDLCPCGSRKKFKRRYLHQTPTSPD
ncbi:MAG: SEC-C domain-containing protein [Deltaproteobacteria bacterium]|nr:SEC-C domain-containing protein [Deltaproteobacteria bacterium]MBW2548097.1 SEC-C domain-containing protein [Deltaproteobacteria bacterium]MBW2720218.1 SEC-C domain-containing protein [Deltaproteobacteria bacterium]